MTTPTVQRTGLRDVGWLLVVEDQPRWAPALRLATRRADPGGRRWRVRTTRERPAAAAMLACASPTILLLEVTEANLAASLESLVATRGAHAIARVALADAPLSDPRLAIALREAGADRVLTSPAQAASVLPFAERHCNRVAARLDERGSARDSVWRRLPWQPDPWPLG